MHPSVKFDLHPPLIRHVLSNQTVIQSGRYDPDTIIVGRSTSYIITHVQFCAMGTIDLGIAGQNYVGTLSLPC